MDVSGITAPGSKKFQKPDFTWIPLTNPRTTSSEPPGVGYVLNITCITIYTQIYIKHVPKNAWSGKGPKAGEMPQIKLLTKRLTPMILNKVF